jgi:hypothetical protein
MENHADLPAHQLVYYLGQSTEDLPPPSYPVRPPSLAATGPPDDDEVSRAAYAHQLLQRSRFYYSMRETPGGPSRPPPPTTSYSSTGPRLPALSSSCSGRPEGQDLPDGSSGGQQLPQPRKKRHESVV